MTLATLRSGGPTLALLWVGCAGGPSTADSPPAPSAPQVVDFLSPEEHAIRASLALRGLRPTDAELAEVAADPAAVDALIDRWLGSPEFARTIREMHGEQLLVRNDANSGNRLPQLGPLAAWNQSQIYASMSDEPLKLIEKVVTEGRPYTEIVTADWMMTDEIVSAAFGPAFDPDGPAWQVSHWTDGRPHAGILSSSQIWRRHLSNANNFHRARANLVISGFLLCEEIAHRPVDFAGVSLPITSDSSDVANALMTEPTCVNCHQSLDPLASTLWGFKRNMFSTVIKDAYEHGCTHTPIPGPPEDGVNYVDDGCYPVRFYNPENEVLWQAFGLRAPGYYGTPVHDLADLGHRVAEDPRFTTCAIERFVSYFDQVPVEEVPQEVVDQLRPTFEASNLDARELVRAIVSSDAFRARSSPPDGPWVPGMMTLRPEQLSPVLDQLLGFAYLEAPDRDKGRKCRPFCYGTVDLVTTEDFGYQSLLGGADAKYHPVPIHTATPLRTLAIDRITAEAAGYTVLTDLGNPDRASRRLLTEVDGTETSGPAVRAQLAKLHAALLDEPVDDAELDATVALFDGEIGRSGDPSEAWRLVITALLRDPRLLHY
ncbi:MAG: DUF1585 domain-containing protein [Myxococcota bacterium]